MKAFKHEIRNKKETIERSEQWSAEIDGYDVIITRDHNGLTEVGIAPISYERLRLPLLKFYPKSVNDIEKLATSLPSLLKTVATEMRDAGLDDLRSKWDITRGIDKVS